MQTYHVFNMEHPETDLLKDWLRGGNENRLSKGNYDWSLVARQYGELYQKLLTIKE